MRSRENILQVEVDESGNERGLLNSCHPPSIDQSIAVSFSFSSLAAYFKLNVARQSTIQLSISQSQSQSQVLTSDTKNRFMGTTRSSILTVVVEMRRRRVPQYQTQWTNERADRRSGFMIDRYFFDTP